MSIANALAAADDRGYNISDSMISIGKLLGHDEKFFDLLEASAQQADTSVHHLVDLLGKLDDKTAVHDLAAFAESRREDKRITQQLTEELSNTFITPLDREDIQALAASLYKIPKTVEKIGERILISPQDLPQVSFRKQVKLLDEAAEAVLSMVKTLRKGTDIRNAREMNTKLQTIEGNADDLELELLRDLYQGNYDARHVIFLRDLYELLEKVIDRCRDAGNVILQIVMKHS
ncbi:MAG: DUF47 domain-containing protein [Chthoniobacterales bacterium]